MRHPTEGVLRRLLDEPAGVSDPAREHVAGCPTCLGVLTTTRRDADLVGAALAPAGSSSVEAGWARLTAAPPAARPVATRSRSGRARRLLRRPVVAAVAVGVVLAGAGTAAATDWLQVFRTEQVTPVAVSSADLVALPDLSAYGDVLLTGDPDVHSVPDAASAARETGLDVPEPAELPQGVRGEPTIQVGGQLEAVFTYSASAPGSAAAQSPPGLDGAQVRLVAGPGAAQIWPSGSGLPALVVARAVAPTAYSSGVPFETLRDHLLSLPGVPADVAAQLRTVTADGSTLPLPVPADLVTTSTADVDGHEATVLESSDRSVAAVVWVQDGVVTAVAGSLDADELLTLARGLR